MTISATTARDDYIGNNTTPTYDYNFRITDATHLRLSEEDTDGIITELAYPTDYTVSGVGLFSGGSITLTAGNLATSYKLTIRPKFPIKQSTDFRNRGGFFPAVHEDAFDYLTIIAQQQQDLIDRSLKFPETDGTGLNTVLPSATVRASRFLACNASGEIIASSGAPDSTVPVSSFMEDLLDDTTSTDALDTLISTLATVTSPTTSNLLLHYDPFAGSWRTITVENTLKSINGLSALSTLALNNEIPIYDGAAKKATLSTLVAYTRRMAPLRGHIAGLTVSNNGTDADHDIDIAAGEATDGTHVELMQLASGVTKQLDATFAEGTAAGGFAAGESLPTSGTVHVWLIAKTDGTTDVFANNHATSGLSPTLPSGFSYKRRIGSWRTDGSANILGATQKGRRFRIDSPVLDLFEVSNTANTWTARTISVPEGVTVEAFGLIGPAAGVTGFVSARDYGAADGNPSSSASPLYMARGIAGTYENNGYFACTTNTSSQVETNTNATIQINLLTMGWFDDLGEND